MRLHSLQALRAIAACLVVIDHSLYEIIHKQSDSADPQIAWAFGSIGVYIFFVISGFIMVHICWNSFDQPAAAANFLRRRIIRIVPLYWLGTIAAFAYHRVSGTHGADDGWLQIVYSLAFIPYSGDNGSWNPVLPQGWTLSYEMLFYLIFAFGLWFPRQIGLITVGLTLGVLVIIGPFIPNETVVHLASPILLWFLPGIGLAIIWRWREFEEPEWLARSAKLLEPLGDASYSTYLAHGIALTIFLRAWVMAAGPPSVWIVPICVAVATVAGWAIHMTVERPILRIITNFWKPRKEAPPVIPARVDS